MGLLGGKKAEGPKEKGTQAEKGLLTKNPVFDGERGTLAPFVNGGVVSRKPTGMVMRKWVKYDKGGETSMVQADKHALTHQLGVQVKLLIACFSSANCFSTALTQKSTCLHVSLISTSRC